MVKKEVTIKHAPAHEDHVERKLADNFIALQKVMTNLAVKFDDLSRNIEKLLQLFEISARNFAEKYSESGSLNQKPGESDQEFLKKLDSLLDQNKTISKGIMMMEERIRNKSPQTMQPQMQMPMRQPMQQMPQPMPYSQQQFQQSPNIPLEGMERSKQLPR